METGGLRKLLYSLGRTGKEAENDNDGGLEGRCVLENTNQEKKGMKKGKMTNNVETTSTALLF